MIATSQNAPTANNPKNFELLPDDTLSVEQRGPVELDRGRAGKLGVRGQGLEKSMHGAEHLPDPCPLTPA